MQIELEVDKAGLRWLDTTPEFIRKGIDKALPKIAIFVEGEAKKNFNGPGQLRVRTGNLRRSIVGEVRKNIVAVGTNVVYGPIHEFGGTINRGSSTITMPKRPFITPAFTDNEEKIEDMLLRELIAEWES